MQNEGIKTLYCLVRITSKLADMAAKLTSCFSSGLSQRRRYNMNKAENEFELPLDEAWKKETFSDNNLRAKNFKFDSAEEP